MRLLWTTIFAIVLALAGFGWWALVVRDALPIVLTVAAGERGSDSHTLMREISEVLERHSDTLRLSVVESDNSSQAIGAIRSGAVDLATIESNTPAYANVNLVADLFADYFLLITRKPENGPPDSVVAIESVADLRGRRIAVPPSGTIANFSFWSIIDHYKLPPEGIRTLALPRDRAIEAFIRRRADAIFFLSSLRDPALLRFIEDAELRNLRLAFIPVAQAEAMALKRPYLSAGRIVRGAFNGQRPLPDDDIAVPILHRLLVAGSDVPPEAVRELVSTIFAKRLDLLIRMPLSAQIDDPRGREVVGLGLHPGAQAFYDRDQPSFLQENAEPMALVVTIFAMLASLGLALRRSLSARAKNRADVYNDILLDIAARARSSRDIADLRAMRDELGDVLEQAVKALDEDRVTEEGFQSFSLLWSSVRETVSERLRDIAIDR